MVKETSFNIIDLHPIILTKIFSYLNLNDLLNLYKVHLKFHKAIKKLVPDKCLVINEELECDDEVQNLENFLSIFGDEVKVLSIEGAEAIAEKLINNYLAGGNVESCELKFFELDQKFIENNLKFFQSLKSLLLIPYCSNYEYVFQVLDIAKQLDMLSLNITNITSINVKRFLNQLTNFQLKKLTLVGVEFYFEDIMDSSPSTSIKELDLYVVQKIDGWFLDHFPNVVSLSLNIEDADRAVFEAIYNHRDLKNLQLEIRSKFCKEIDLFLATLVKFNSLESFRLSIRYFKMDSSMCHKFCEMTNLRELNISGIDTMYFYLLKIVNKLTELRKITISVPHSSNESKSKTVEKLSEVVHIGRNLTTIVINSLRSFEKHHYEEMYAKLTDIRRKQKSESVLRVEVSNGLSSVCFKTGKWVTMIVS